MATKHPPTQTHKTHAPKLTETKHGEYLRIVSHHILRYGNGKSQRKNWIMSYNSLIPLKNIYFIYLQKGEKTF